MPVAEADRGQRSKGPAQLVKSLDDKSGAQPVCSGENDIVQVVEACFADEPVREHLDLAKAFEDINPGQRRVVGRGLGLEIQLLASRWGWIYP